MSFGTNRERGKIVNAFGMGANPEVASLGDDLAPRVARTQSVGLAFTDAFQNFWVAHRLTGRAVQSVLTHEQLPEDDSYVPDPVTRLMKDSSGETKRVRPVSHEDVATDFFLLPSASNLNPEIVEQPLPPPVWSNGTYQLQKVEALRDFLFVGRGFYRSEFLKGGRPWWEPVGVNRWTREGWEFYLLKASKPGEPYRVAFTAMVGYGYPGASRTLEFWHGDRKFDEMTITDVARVVSAPFYPEGDIDRVTVVVRERTRIIPRGLGLWHIDYPKDTRHLNLLVSSAALVRPGERPARASTAIPSPPGKSSPGPTSSTA